MIRAIKSATPSRSGQPFSHKLRSVTARGKIHNNHQQIPGGCCPIFTCVTEPSACCQSGGSFVKFALLMLSREGSALLFMVFPECNLFNKI